MGRFFSSETEGKKYGLVSIALVIVRMPLQIWEIPRSFSLIYVSNYVI